MTDYMITTDRGGPLYFRATKPEAEQFAAAWQAELGATPMVVVVACEDDDEAVEDGMRPCACAGCTEDVAITGDGVTLCGDCFMAGCAEDGEPCAKPVPRDAWATIGYNMAWAVATPPELTDAEMADLPGTVADFVTHARTWTARGYYAARVIAELDAMACCPTCGRAIFAVMGAMLRGELED